MRAVDQVVLALQTAAAALLGLLALLVAAGWREPVRALVTALATVEGRLGLAAAGALLLLGGLRVAAAALARAPQPASLVFPSALGEVQVSLAAVEGLVQRLGRQVEGVRDLRVRVRREGDGLALALTAWVTGDVALPDLCARLQQVLSERVRQVVGVPVQHVQVSVREIGGESRRRRLD